MERSRDEQVEFLRNLMLTNVRGIVVNEAGVELVEHVMTEQIVWEVTVDEHDMGLAIGSQAAHVQAIRLLLNVASKKTEFKYNLSIVSRDRKRR